MSIEELCEWVLWVCGRCGHQYMADPILPAACPNC
jgi:DNA-directed RNA polymerase subunit RPC12/RpoP